MTATENEVITYIPQIWCFIKSLTPPFLIEVSASSKKIEWSSICVIGINLAFVSSITLLILKLCGMPVFPFY